jgi:stalled ribosome rescue protein Dom34
MMTVSFQRKYRRGYPVAVLVGLKEGHAVLWKVFSHVVKPEKTVPINGSRNDQKAAYNFHEAIINALRPTLKEGVKSIIVASPPRTSFSGDFLRHIKEHHAWLMGGPSKAAFAEVTGLAATMHEVTVLTRTVEFRKIIGETTTEEIENLLELLEKRLNVPAQEPLVLYALEDIENAILGVQMPGKPEPEYLLLTDTQLSGSRQKFRLQRLMQIATNKGVKTRVVKSDTATGKRLLQLGGIVCILKEPAK